MAKLAEETWDAAKVEKAVSWLKRFWPFLAAGTAAIGGIIYKVKG